MFVMLRAALRSFAPARRGNVSMLFAFSLLPLIGLVGLGVDYGVSLNAKAKLDNAADSAALAAVATAKAFVAANQSSPTVMTDAVTAGLNRAYRAFTVNAGSVAFGQIPTPVITMPPITNQTISATVRYSTTTQNHFGQLFGQAANTVQGSTAASTNLPSYLDFYLLIDVSGSMGLPTTAAGMSQLAANNRDMYSDYQQGCQFACHFPGYTAYTYAVAHQIQLRSDAVNNAVCSLLSRAATPSVPNQYRIGIYPFINQMATLAAITTNITTLQTTAQCGSSWPLAFTNLLDTGTTQLSTGGDPTTGTGSGGTHFEVVFPQITSKISSFGDGSTAAKSRPFVFLITDGMENGQHFSVPSGSNYAYPGNPSSFPGYANAWWDGSSPSQINPSVCAALKAASNGAATLSILYIPYNQISFVNNSGSVAWENNQVNGFSPTLATPLQTCASPGYFYTANTPADITNALNAMFNQANQVAHLTQ